MVSFPGSVKIDRVEIKFQGGFASSQVEFEAMRVSETNEKSFSKICEFYPEDVNSAQVI